MSAAPIRAVLVDIGGTLVDAAAPATPVEDLKPVFRPGARRLLRALAGRGVALGAVTDTSVMREADVRRALGEEVSGLLTAVVTSVDAGAAKPDPAGVRMALERLGCAPGEGLFVGDQPADAGAAEAAGVDFVSVAGDRAIDRAVLDYLEARSGAFRAATAMVGPLDAAAVADAEALQADLTKPPGSLGHLEAVGVQLAGIAGLCPPPVPAPGAVTVFAGDHGVLAQGVSPWPQEVTAQMVANFLAGGAAINVLAAAAGASVTVVDVGVATPIPKPPAAAGGPVFLDRRVRAGTADTSQGPAMSTEEALAALDAGAAAALAAARSGAGVLLTGDMGIGNTTPAAALVAAFTGRGAAEVTGRGTGIDDPTLARKVRAVADGLARLPAGAGPVEVLAEVGGLEHAALAGYVLGGAAAGLPVIADGVIALSGVLAAAAIAPAVTGSVIAGHRSAEPGATAALEHLGLRPVLDLGLRLGEGSGAALALPVVQAAARVMREMATFSSAGISEA